MDLFIETPYLSEIIDQSKTEPVIIFKYSNSCVTSTRLKVEFEEEIKNKKLLSPVFLVTVQTQKSLSKQIEDFFNIKHESPQIIVLKNGKVTFSANHTFIKIKDLLA